MRGRGGVVMEGGQGTLPSAGSESDRQGGGGGLGGALPVMSAAEGEVCYDH